MACIWHAFPGRLLNINIGPIISSLIQFRFETNEDGPERRSITIKNLSPSVMGRRTSKTAVVTFLEANPYRNATTTGVSS